MPQAIKRVVMFSGGLGSYMAAKRVAKKHGTKHMVLLFTDTLIEDEDLYRFLPEAAADIGAPLIRIADGRTPWQVFDDEKFLGNTRIDPCSKLLKRKMADDWLAANCNPDRTIVYLGIDYTERHRFDDGNGHGARFRYERNGWMTEAPLCQAPYINKSQVLSALAEAGIELPLLYKLGFSHNNCGGFCIKAGHGHFLNLLLRLPERFELHARAEAAFRRKHKVRSTILRDRRGGSTRPLSLLAFRKRIKSTRGVPPGIDITDIGGCGCFLD